MNQEEWEKFKQFIQSDTVIKPNGAILPLLLKFYEYGLKNQVPPEWKDYQQLMHFRENKFYTKALALERKVGQVRIVPEEEVDDKKPVAKKRKR